METAWWKILLTKSPSSIGFKSNYEKLFNDGLTVDEAIFVMKPLIIEQLKINVEIQGANYWEIFKYEKDLALQLGGNNPKVKKLHKDLEEARNILNNYQQQLKQEQES